MYLLQLFDIDNAAQPLDARMLRDGTISIGRDTTCDWVITDPERALSREHCELAATLDGLIVRAIGPNGVFDDSSGDRLPDLVDTAIQVPSSLRMGRFRIHASLAAPDDDSLDTGKTMVLTPPLGTSSQVPTDWTDAQPLPQTSGESLLDAFCRGAGLDASMLSGEHPQEVMERAGATYRQMVIGIADLMMERDSARSRYDLGRTTVGGAGNNPFKWAPSQRLAIDLLLASDRGFLSGPEAITNSLEAIKQHLIASFAGFQAALHSAVESFSGSALDEAITDKASLLKSRSALQMKQVEARHADLVEQLGGAAGSLDRAFAQAYAATEKKE